MSDMIRLDEAFSRTNLGRRLPLIFFGLLAMWLFLNVWDYGMSWDEPFRAKAGAKKLFYYNALAEGDWHEAREFRDRQDYYPGGFDLIAAFMRQFSPFGWSDTGHLLSTFFGFVAAVGTFFVARLWLPGHFALWAPVFLILMPRFYGHIFVNPKDIPFAATFVWGVWGILRCCRVDRTPSWRASVLFGVLCGLCMSTRIGGMLLIPYAAVALGAYGFAAYLRNQIDLRGLVRRALHSIGWLAVASAIAFVVLLPWWPAAHANPFSRAVDTLGEISNFTWQGRILYWGVSHAAGELPWHYLPFMLLITAPPIVLISLVFGMIRLIAVRPWQGGIDRCVSETMIRALILLFFIVFPVGYIIGKDAVVYDGIRHILFVLPLIAVITALALHRAWLWVSSNRGWMSPVMVAVVLISTMGTVREMVRLHPYQYTYFNWIIGGLPGASGRFDTEYWATSMRECAEFLNAYVEDLDSLPPYRVGLIPPPAVVLEKFERIVICPPELLTYYLRSDFVYADIGRPYEFFVSSPRFGFDEMVEGETIFTVERRGVVFASVKRVSEDSGAER